MSMSVEPGGKGQSATYAVDTHCVAASDATGDTGVDTGQATGATLAGGQ